MSRKVCPKCGWHGISSQLVIKERKEPTPLEMLVDIVARPNMENRLHQSIFRAYLQAGLARNMDTIIHNQKYPSIIPGYDTYLTKTYGMLSIDAIDTLILSLKKEGRTP